MIWLTHIIQINTSMTTEIMLKLSPHTKVALEARDGKMVSNFLHLTTNMTTSMLQHKWESHLSLKTEMIKTIWLTHTIQTNTKTIMEITLNTSLPKHNKEISEIMHKLAELQIN